MIRASCADDGTAFAGGLSYPANRAVTRSAITHRRLAHRRPARARVFLPAGGTDGV